MVRIRVSRVVLGGYLYLPKSELSAGQQQALMEECTVHSKFGGEGIALFNDCHPAWLGLPLYHNPPPLYSGTILDRRTVGEGQAGISFQSEYRPGQKEIIESFQNYLKLGRTSFILEAKPGTGKCHGAGTELLMYDGSVKKVEYVRVGDLLMGPDSRPRTVLSIAQGRGELFQIVPTKGEGFTCNADHILSLRASGGFSPEICHDDCHEVSVREFLGRNITYQRRMKLWRVPVVFQSRQVPFEPYFVGVYLGDGHKRQPCVTIGDKDPERVAYLKQWARSHAFYVREDRTSSTGCTSFFMPQYWHPGNDLKDRLFPMIFRGGEKRVPEEYLINDEAVRLEVLAGILDADGYLSSGIFDFLTKYRGLAEDVAFLARTLGFSCKVSPCQKSCPGFVGEYFRLSIGGDLDRIPCLLLRRKASYRRQRKNWLRTGFSVEPLGLGEYFGFELDGDGLYLLKDCTVTHNTVLALKMLSLLDRKALVVVPRSNLVRQWVERIQEHTNLSRSQIGIAEDGRADWGGKSIVVALVHTLALDRFGPEFKRNFGVVVFDEVHRSVPPRTFASVGGMFPARYRIALSATLSRPDGLDSVFREHLGDCLLGSSRQERFKPTVLLYRFDRDCGPVYGSGKLQRRGQLISRLAESPQRNWRIAWFVKSILNSGRRCLVLSDRIYQLLLIRRLLLGQYKLAREDVGVYIRGGGKKARAELVCSRLNLKDEKRKVLERGCSVVLATYGIFDLGTDIPDLSGLIYATPQKDTRQARGRIERIHPGKKIPVVVDIVDVAYKETLLWARARQLEYKTEGLTVKFVERVG